MFPTLSYLEWISGRPDAATHDLGSSDLRPADEPTGVVPPALEGLPDPPDGTELEAQIAAEYGVEPANVLVTAGATHANFLAAATAIGLVDADEPRVLVEKPGYEPLVRTPELFCGRPIRFSRSVADGFELDPGRVEAAVTDETALVTVTNHHNPSGRPTGRATFAETSRIVADHGATLLVDEVYAPFVTDPVESSSQRTPFGGESAVGLPNVVVTNSLTKFHGLGGLNIGWLVADEEFVAAARSVGWHVPTVAQPSIELAKRTFHNAETLAERSRELLAENHALLAAFVADREDLTGDVFPDNTFAFPAHERADGDEVAAAAWDAGVLVVPGRFFDAPDRFRVSLGRNPGAARAGLDAFGNVLDSL